jgi:uncharacterized membrane protein YjgN (DUF898 family)
MSVEPVAPWGRIVPTTVKATFSGTRSELFGRLIAGYLLMIPTLGLYRFWLTTAKRRFYWQNTSIGGDRLEYTGTALQLLIGFLIALGVFLPIYMVFFYLSFQASVVTLIGYGLAGALLWFLTGYAIYRARDFRLSRTLWRGIRFDQRGSALRYAIRRFLWSLLVIITLGLAYPFMAGNLWRYRYDNTWFGDRQFSFAGSWKTIAGPYYRAWLALAGTITAGTVASVVEGAPSKLFMLLAVVAPLCFFYYRARETSLMFSKVRLGEASLTVQIKARSLMGQYIVYILALAGSLILLVLGGLGIFSVVSGSLEVAEFSPAAVARVGWLGLMLSAGGYLVSLAAFTLLGEVFVDCGYWMLVTRGATITNIESLDDVRASTEDKSVAGEGLADALNVGAY